jgi:hypothetical protein
VFSPHERNYSSYLTHCHALQRFPRLAGSTQMTRML